MIRVYGIADCKWCDKAKEFLDDVVGKDHYTYIEVNDRDTAREFRETFEGAKTFPQILWGDNKIPGYEALVRKVENERGDILFVLSERRVPIKFMKTNGEVTERTVTLRKSDLPIKDLATDYVIVDAKQKTKVNVWSVTDDGWRSFNWANLRQFGNRNLPYGV